MGEGEEEAPTSPSGEVLLRPPTRRSCCGPPPAHPGRSCCGPQRPNQPREKVDIEEEDTPAAASPRQPSPAATASDMDMYTWDDDVDKDGEAVRGHRYADRGGRTTRLGTLTRTRCLCP